MKEGPFFDETLLIRASQESQLGDRMTGPETLVGSSPRTLRRRMRQGGLVWKRARPVFANREPHLAQKKGPLSGS